MAPKVKSTTPIDSMETQLASPTEAPSEVVSQTQCALDPDAPQTKKRGRPKGKASGSNTTKNRAPRAPQLKHLISKKSLVHLHVVQKVLRELETLCVEEVKTKGVFRMGIVTVMLREAREASVKLGGKDITKAKKAESRTVHILPGRTLKKLCK